MVEIKEIYAVNQGDNEFNCGQPRWFFDAKTDAELCAVGRGWFGGVAPVRHHPAIVVDGKMYLLARVEPVNLNESPEDEQAKKNAARAKLTEAERKLLGVQ